MEKGQFKKDTVYKRFKEGNKRIKSISVTPKHLDRLTLMRMKEALQSMNIRNPLVQKTSTREEHIKEKKISIKKTNISTELPLQRKEEMKEFTFLFELKEIIKKKVYKQLSPLLYFSIPSLKLLHQPNKGTLDLQDTFFLQII